MEARPGPANSAGASTSSIQIAGHVRRAIGPIVPKPVAAGPLRRLLTHLLRVPLFYKILLANAALVILVAVLSSAVTMRLIRTWPVLDTPEVVTMIAILGAVISLAINAVILRVALTPLRGLERTADRIQAGELEARAPLSPLADRDLERLVVTFNGMLDSSASYRRRLQEIAARAMTAAEDERKRIARELHDGIAQTLAALRIRLRVARAARTDADRNLLLEEISEEIGSATEEVRRIARGLRPPALDMLGLAPAIESHVRGLAEATGLAVDIKLAPVSGHVSPEAELALYRVIQEALSNVVRHARASQIRVRMHRRPGFIEATVEDDGRGFSVEQAMADGDRGLGLFGMQERAAYVGGRVDITSRPGEGTCIRVIIPRSEAEHG